MKLDMPNQVQKHLECPYHAFNGEFYDYKDPQHLASPYPESNKRLWKEYF